jgi:hypothetical protein
MADNGVDYKKKYEDLKARYIQSLDVAFRTGYEQGFSESQNQAMAQQAQMQFQGMAGSGMQPPPGAETVEVPSGQEPSASEQQPETADELDQAISTLEKLVNKSEPSIEDLKKSIEMIKTEHLHKKITKKTKSIDITPKQYSQSYRVNLPENSKAEVAMQQRIVDDILRKWEKEQGQSSRDITQVLGTEALTKKE